MPSYRMLDVTNGYDGSPTDPTWVRLGGGVFYSTPVVPDNVVKGVWCIPARLLHGWRDGRPARLLSGWREGRPAPLFVGGEVVNGFGVRVSAPQIRSNLPQYMPQVRLVRYDLSGTRSVLHSATDASANVAAYQAPHWIRMADATRPRHTPQAGSRYFIEVQPEYGTNSLQGMQIIAAYVDTAQAAVSGEFSPGSAFPTP